MEQKLVAGNQQATFCELSWLGGIIDGEGCITVVKGPPGRYGHSANPIVTIANTGERMIQKIEEIFKRHGIAYYLTTHQPKRGKCKTFVRVVGFKRVQRLLFLLLPYLVEKAERAFLLMEFCAKRNGKTARDAYTDYELSLCQRIWDSVGKGTTWGKTQKKSSTTTCAARSA